MIAAIATCNILVGLVYTQYGTMTLIEMRRNWGTMGFSHFGAAWIAMAFTCGPHHLVHGVHMAFEGRGTVPADLLVVLVGMPAGIIWFLLRVEAFMGGRGDRFVSGTPWWVLVLPSAMVAYCASLVTTAAHVDGGLRVDQWWAVLPSVLLVWLYGMVGYYVIRTQIANRKPLGGWSVSGLALGAIFPTCAVMHAVYGWAILTADYAFDSHGFVVDVIAVPAAVYFVAVVRALHNGSFRDWNRVSGALAAAAERGRAAAGPAPDPVVSR